MFLLHLYSYVFCSLYFFLFFFKQKTAYEMRISDWSSDVCSSDLGARQVGRRALADAMDVHAVGAGGEAARDDLEPEAGAVLEDIDAAAIGALGVATLCGRVGDRQRTRRIAAHAAPARQPPRAQQRRNTAPTGQLQPCCRHGDNSLFRSDH